MTITFKTTLILSFTHIQIILNYTEFKPKLNQSGMNIIVILPSGYINLQSQVKRWVRITLRTVKGKV